MTWESGWRPLHRVSTRVTADSVITDVGPFPPSGLPPAFKGVDRARKDAAIKEALALAGLILENAIKEIAPFDTGALVNSIRTYGYNPRTRMLTVEVGVPYASFLEDGTRFIAPRRFVERGVFGALDNAENAYRAKLEQERARFDAQFGRQRPRRPA